MQFSIYGLEFDVPKEYKIQIWKGSLFFEGTVEFMDFQNNLVRVDWNDMAKVMGAHTNMREFFDDYLGKIKAEKTLSNFDLKEFPHEGMGDHEYYFYKLSYTTFRKFPHKEISDYIIGFGALCRHTGRTVVIQYRPPEGQPGIEDVVMGIIRSFRCRCAEQN